MPTLNFTSKLLPLQSRVFFFISLFFSNAEFSEIRHDLDESDGNKIALCFKETLQKSMEEIKVNRSSKNRLDCENIIYDILLIII